VMKLRLMNRIAAPLPADVGLGCGDEVVAAEEAERLVREAARRRGARVEEKQLPVSQAIRLIQMHLDREAEKRNRHSLQPVELCLQQKRDLVSQLYALLNKR